MSPWYTKENLKIIAGTILVSIISSLIYDGLKIAYLDNVWPSHASIFTVFGAYTYVLVKYALIFVIFGTYTYLLVKFLRDLNKKKVAKLVESYEKQVSKLVESHEEQLCKIHEINKEKFKVRTGFHHDFEHKARNLGVQLMRQKLNDDIFINGPNPVSLSGEAHKLYREELRGILEALIAMFKTLVPEGTNVWACIRERKSDDKYYTMIRAGIYNSSRDQFSQPIHKHAKTILNLKDNYSLKKECVLITGSGAIGKATGREPVENDLFKEDLSVLMGAVMSKSYNGQDFDRKMLNWILCINANKEGVFNESHIPLMKCCNDTFSWLLNMFIRKSYEGIK